MRLTKQEFIDRFTPVEMATLLSAAKVSVELEAWLFRFNSVTPDADGTSIDTNDPRTIAGVSALELSGIIASGRATEILAEPVPSEPGEHALATLGPGRFRCSVCGQEVSFSAYGMGDPCVDEDGNPPANFADWMSPCT